MSKKAMYKGREYSSRSQAALVMLSDNLTMEMVAKELGITPQTVFAVKKRAQEKMYSSIKRAERQAQEALKKAQKLSEKTSNLSKIYKSLTENYVDGRTRRHTRINKKIYA